MPIQAKKSNNSTFLQKKPNQTFNKTSTSNLWFKPNQNSLRDNKNSSPRNNNFKNAININFINEQIKAFNIIVIDDNWENIWEMSRYDALNLAKSKWLDLMQIQYDRDRRVSTAKILDYGKYMYEKKRKEKESKQKQKQQSKEMKEIKFSYWISENDMNRKLEQLKEWLKNWHPVKLKAEVKWREKNFKDRVIDKIKKIEESLLDCSRSQFGNPKEEKKWYYIILNPWKKK